MVSRQRRLARHAIRLEVLTAKSNAVCQVDLKDVHEV